MRVQLLLSAVLLASTATVAAPEQTVVPPKARYWMSATTSSGFSMSGGGKADMMKAMMGGGGATKQLNLDLGSTLAPSGAPKADALIPPGMAMGKSLPLTTPMPTKSTAPARSEDEDFEKPKGRLLLFWGCGDTARPGQPLVIDFAKMASGEIPPNMFGSERIRIARPPSPANSRTYGGWPLGDKNYKGIPAPASLLGAHAVQGNYSPAIAFDLPQDWLAPLTLAAAATPNGGQMLSWNAVGGATGYVASMMGGGGNGKNDNTVVFWISSESQSFISGLTDYLAPAEVARLVGKKMVMPPSQTSCAIPAEAIKATQGAIITLVGHGPEINRVQPPRPSDPKIPWVQDWTAKARFRTTAGAMLAGGQVMTSMGGVGGASTASDDAGSRSNCPAPSGGSVNPAEVMGSAIAGSVGGAIGAMFGSKKKKTDPNCPQ